MSAKKATTKEYVEELVDPLSKIRQDLDDKPERVPGKITVFVYTFNGKQSVERATRSLFEKF